MSAMPKWVAVPLPVPERFWDGNLRTDLPESWVGIIRHVEGCWFERYARWQLAEQD